MGFELITQYRGLPKMRWHLVGNSDEGLDDIYSFSYSFAGRLVFSQWFCCLKAGCYKILLADWNLCDASFMWQRHESCFFVALYRILNCFLKIMISIFAQIACG